MGVLTWSPLGFGFLTGRHRKGATPTSTGRVALRPGWFDPDEPAVARKLDGVEGSSRLPTTSAAPSPSSPSRSHSLTQRSRR